MHLILRVLGLLMIRVFYRSIAVLEPGRIPTRGPVVVVANHPNGLLDPLVARVALGRPLAFLGKSTIFGNPFGRLAARAFDVIPVYRPKDGADTSKNEETFARSRELLARGGWLMLFPEGISHSASQLQPMKTGAARIILASARDDIQVLPLGLVFDAKAEFRSRAVVSVGEPLATAPFLARFATDERGAVAALTARIGEAVAGAMLQAPSPELWKGFLAVAAWTGEGAAPPLAELTARAKVLEAGYQRLVVADPDRAQAIVERTRRFATLLESVGVDDPFSLVSAEVLRPARLVRFALLATLLAPLAAIGVVLGWVPYQVVRFAAARVTQEDDVVGTVKGIAGLVFYPLGWLAWAIALGVGVAWPVGLAALVLGPIGGWVALWLADRFAARRAALGGWWLRMSRAELAARVTTARRELAADVAAALRDVSA